MSPESSQRVFHRINPGLGHLQFPLGLGKGEKTDKEVRIRNGEYSMPRLSAGDAYSLIMAESKDYSTSLTIRGSYNASGVQDYANPTVITTHEQSVTSTGRLLNLQTNGKPVTIDGLSFINKRTDGGLGVEATVDADGAGRAVPALETLLLHVNGCPTTPIALANGVNDKITVELADPHNAPLAEKIGRDICGEFGNMVGISGWLVNKEDIEKRIITGSITLCEKIGAIMRRANCPAEQLFEMLVSEGLVQAKVVCVGEVTDIRVETHGGFDYGTLDVTDGTDSYRVNFQNENLLLQKKTGTGYADLMTVPDLTCMYCVDPAGAAGVETRMPLSNADVKKGMRIALGVIKVDPKWFLTDGTWWNVWKECFDHIGYTGGYLSYDNV